ncbi:uncharacterized protein TNCV_4636691 [Trichonephila clavipes]|nr:uncharacterized protein TNCV_4636691 [Trichonephila clavipes]
MITNFFIPELNNHDVQELSLQQDGGTCHTARATIDLLKDTLGDRLISRFGPVNWPPRSCDLTPLDYFLWGYVKSLVYADKPQTLDHLEENIRRVIADIRPQMLKKSSKIGRPDWITSEPAVAVLCQKSYLKSKTVAANHFQFGVVLWQQSHTHRHTVHVERIYSRTSFIRINWDRTPFGYAIVQITETECDPNIENHHMLTLKPVAVDSRFEANDFIGRAFQFTPVSSTL